VRWASASVASIARTLRQRALAPAFEFGRELELGDAIGDRLRTRAVGHQLQVAAEPAEIVERGIEVAGVVLVEPTANFTAKAPFGHQLQIAPALSQTLLHAAGQAHMAIGFVVVQGGGQLLARRASDRPKPKQRQRDPRHRCSLGQKSHSVGTVGARSST
jgi:hypothetical protein